MWIITTIVFASIALALSLRLRRISQMLESLDESAKRYEPLLIEKRSHYGIGKQIEDLHQSLNTLIGETRQGRNQNRDYLHQIETTLGSIKEAVLILDNSHYVRMANEAARQLIGNNQDLLGRRVESLLPSVGFLDYVRGTWKGRRSGTEVVEILKGDDLMWFEVNGALIKDEGPRNKLSLFVLHDITRLKLLEDMRTEFVANVSHELRTPVTVIRGFTDTMLEENAEMDADDRLHFLSKIQRNVVRLNTLLEDLLTLSRMEGRATALMPERVSINEIIEDACENFVDRKPDGVELIVNLEKRAPMMNIDPLRITQVLENLLDNAARHAKGMSELKVTTTLEGTELFRCTIEDNGCGIPPMDVPHIFERFYRVDKGRSRELGGTGLGLSIVKHIIQKHGGQVFVTSRLGEGTSMGFELPLATL